MKRQIRRAMAGALAMPATALVIQMPTAPAATVLAVEGTAQARGNAQTAFNGEFCRQNTCRSINNARSPFDVKTGSRQLQTAVDATPGDIVLMGYSLGAATIYDRLREWAKTPATAPDRDRLVLVVTFGNPENKFGGDDKKNSYAGLPAEQPYQHLDVTMQYDSVADSPTRWGWYSMLNNAFAQHVAYFEDVDINDPDNLVHRDQDGSTYMLIKADVLPMLKWMDPWLSDGKMAELDAKYRPLVEKDYDRPAYVPQGEGADWGNGNPPPTIDGEDDSDDDVTRVTARATAEPESNDDESDDDDRARGKRGKDEVETDADTEAEGKSETDADAEPESETERDGSETDDSGAKTRESSVTTA